MNCKFDSFFSVLSKLSSKKFDILHGLVQGTLKINKSFFSETHTWTIALEHHSAKMLCKVLE